MAAITPTGILRVNLGSGNLVIATFSTVADGDTWASTIPATSTQWAQLNGNPATQANAGIACTFSAGTFTFYPAEDGLPFRLHVVIE